jgi:hypothetical protein
MRNPPYAFFLALPLGFLGQRSGAAAWSLGIIAALMIWIRLITKMQGRRAEGMTGCTCWATAFLQRLPVYWEGRLQRSSFSGWSYFSNFESGDRTLEGRRCFLCALKPHLFIPFGTILLLWIVTRRRYRILAGASIAFGAALLFGLYLDPHGWAHYFAMMKSEDLANEFIPTVSLFFA